MTSARRAFGARNESLQSAAMRLYDEAGRNSKAAIELLITEMRKRPALVEDIYRVAAETLIGALDRGDRARIMRGMDTGTVSVPTPEVANDQPTIFKPQSAASVAASNAAFKRFAVTLTGLYLFKVKDGNGGEFLLGQATPEQLRGAEAHYRAQGSTMVRTARWLEKIIACSPEDTPIHKSLNLKEIERMKDDAFSTGV
ncbi:hypothetical protein J0664_05830 [Rhizobium leguminosarum]|uniref:hypothetical protein n=1 Tax=Rhizobium leguminosarum TaxID=384 RepID=UPI001A9168B3|nr:hypothetical protein [Rhizobium leguminosarum]MBY5553771.1 hypothetical protein [Rhizobium leguminosarum]QSW24819.1 hypothetical protein J0664_05830 [Rhizobium leguminosarum]